MNKRCHDVTPKTERRPLKQLKPNVLLSPRVIAAGVLKNDKPVMNCSFENVTPVSEERKKKINTLVKLMDNLKAQIPAHEEFIEKCEKEIEDYQELTQDYQVVAKRTVELKNEPIVVRNIEACVPIIAKNVLDNFIKQKLAIEEPNTEFEEELIILTQRHEKLSRENSSLVPEISRLLEEFDNEIEVCNKKLEKLEHF
uniref:Uncharacterized protein n=2 Tax=Panagrolaimus superbus TaxID=310955 RepID=A0A914Y7L0_9BILA